MAAKSTLTHSALHTNTGREKLDAAESCCECSARKRERQCPDAQRGARSTDWRLAEALARRESGGERRERALPLPVLGSRTAVSRGRERRERRRCEMRMKCTCSAQTRSARFSHCVLVGCLDVFFFFLLLCFNSMLKTCSRDCSSFVTTS